MEAATLSPD